jgi:hypothetical protein
MTRLQVIMVAKSKRNNRRHRFLRRANARSTQPWLCANAALNCSFLLPLAGERYGTTIVGVNVKPPSVNVDVISLMPLTVWSVRSLVLPGQPLHT